EQYRASMKTNEECGLFIHRSIGDNFRNNFLDVKKIAAEVTEKYGFERAMLMLALRVNSLEWDGRIDKANKEWASKFLAGYPNAEAIRKVANSTLGTTHPVLLDSVAEEVRFTFHERNKGNQQVVEGYRIIQKVKTPFSEYVLGQNCNMPGYYVTWYNSDHNGGLSPEWGHYYSSNNSEKNRISAYRDLFTRALSNLNEHTEYEELTPQKGSILRTINGEEIQFVLTDDERNEVWDMVEQQNVENHFKVLLRERGYDLNIPGMESIIADMSEDYRNDFCYGTDEEYEEYLIERKDDIDQLTCRGMFDENNVDTANISDYAGRVMILRPEYLKPDMRIPENQLFLAQLGTGCDPKKCGSQIIGVFLYDREAAAIHSDNFLGAMREECIPTWAREAREDITEEESNDEQPEM
ncbi:MAG: DUF3849 domain-containing protein, partial [Oscillospiraceae bacterium]